MPPQRSAAAAVSAKDMDDWQIVQMLSAHSRTRFSNLDLGNAIHSAAGLGKNPSLVLIMRSKSWGRTALIPCPVRKNSSRGQLDNLPNVLLLVCSRTPEQIDCAQHG